MSEDNSSAPVSDEPERTDDGETNTASRRRLIR